MINYNKLWKLLIDLGMTKQDLRKKADFSSSTLSKLRNGQNITTDILCRICAALDCDFGDIMEYVKEKGGESNEKQ